MAKCSACKAETEDGQYIAVSAANRCASSARNAELPGLANSAGVAVKQ